MKTRFTYENDQNKIKIYDEFINKVSDQTLQNLLSNFQYYYMNFSQDPKKYDVALLNQLKRFKFITYMISSIDEEYSSDEIKVIFCAEKSCFIVENAEINIINKIINESNATFLNITNLSKKTSSENDNQSIHEEIQLFIYHFRGIIASNSFLKDIINPIVAYIIRRYYYPSNYFRDQSFFTFSISNNKIYEQNHFEIKPFETNIVNNENTNNAEFVIENKEINDTKTEKTKYSFKLNDFILLRNIGNKYRLALYLKTFYLFAIKIELKTNNNIMNEIIIVNNYQHRCITPFYGFFEEKNYIYLVYEFMCNGNLLDYLEMKKVNIDYFFSFMSILRIFEGINYLHSNSIIHQDLTPSNILLNHDFIPYIADFDTITKNNWIDMKIDIGTPRFLAPEQFSDHKNVSFHTDIYYFGINIYYLFDHEKEYTIRQSKFEQLPQMIHFSDDFKQLYNKCVENDPTKRPNRNEIKDFLINHLLTFDNLKYYVKKNHFTDKKIEMNRYLNENIIFLKENATKEQITMYTKNFPNFRSFLYYIGNIIYNGQIMKNNDSNYYIIKANNYYNEDIDKAMEFYQLAAQHGDANGWNSLGYIYDKIKKNYVKAIECYNKAIEIGNPNANNNLAYLCKYGIGIARDYPKAIYHYTKSAKMGNAKAHFELGILQLNGLGCQKNFQTALNNFIKSAELKFTPAYNILGDLYFKGNGLEQNYSLAKKYYDLAFEYKCPIASLKIGMMYKNGQGVEQNYFKAFDYFFKSQNYGNFGSFYQIAKLFEYGKGCIADIQKALYYLNECSKKKSEIIKIYFQQSWTKIDVSNDFYFQSINDMGVIYITKLNNIEKGIKYLKQLTYDDYPLGQYNCGVAYQFYLNKIQDAEYFYNKSSKYQFSLSEFNLGYIEEINQNNNKAAEHYLKALKFKDKPFIHHNIEIQDEMLDFSNIFIICLTNLKLLNFYQSDSLNDDIKSISEEKLILNVLFRPLFYLIMNENCQSFSFCFDVIKENEKYIIKNLKIFFLHFMNIINSFSETKNTNTSEKIKFVQINIQSDTYKMKDFDIEKFVCIDDFLLTDEVTKIFDGLNRKKIFKISHMFPNSKSNTKKIVIESSRDSIKRYIEYPLYFEQILIRSVKNMKSIISDIIAMMNGILYEPPYSILFGKYTKNANTQTKNNDKKFQQKTNELFYDGIMIDFK